MIESWLSLPLPALVLALAGFYAAAALALCWLSFGPRTGAWAQAFRGVVGPYFTSTAIILGLLVGFLANDIWDRNQQAERSVLAERDGLLNLYNLATLSGAAGDGLRDAIRAYARAVVEKEWPQLARQNSSTEATAALDDLVRRVARGSPAAPEGASLDATLLDAVMEVRAAREARLALSVDRTEGTKWAAALILAVTTQIGLALVHLEKPRPQAAALAVFSFSIVVLFALLAAHEAPFRPPLFVSPAPIAAVLAIVPGT